MDPITKSIQWLFPDPDPLLLADIEALGVSAEEVAEAVGCLLDTADVERTPASVGGRKVYDLLVDALDEEDEDTASERLPAIG